MSVLSHTHLHRKTCILFTPDHCETCDALVQSPNGIRVVKSDHDKIIALGITEVKTLPPEAWWSEDKFQEACPNCEGDEAFEENDGQPDEAQEWHDFDPDC